MSARRASATSPRGRRSNCRGRATFSAAVSAAARPKVCGNEAEVLADGPNGALDRLPPFTSTSPSVGRRMPARTWSRVVFPAPAGPVTTRTRPGPASRSMPSRMIRRADPDPDVDGLQQGGALGSGSPGVGLAHAPGSLMRRAPRGRRAVGVRHAQVHAVGLAADPHERVGWQHLEHVGRQLHRAVAADDGELLAVTTLGADPSVTDRDRPAGWRRRPPGRG